MAAAKAILVIENDNIMIKKRALLYLILLSLIPISNLWGQEGQVQPTWESLNQRGYPLPNMEEGESWNHKGNDPRYLPLQVQPGDLALFLQKNAIEIKYDGDKYFIVPQSAILLVERDEF